MSSLRKFAVAWLLMWAFAYIMTAFFAPYIGAGDVIVNFAIFYALGSWILCSLILYWVERFRFIGRIFLFILGLVEVFGGIASWCGLVVWNVPFANKEIFQVSMAFADLISAVFMFYLAID